MAQWLLSGPTTNKKKFKCVFPYPYQVPVPVT